MADWNSNSCAFDGVIPLLIEAIQHFPHLFKRYVELAETRLELDDGFVTGLELLLRGKKKKETKIAEEDIVVRKRLEASHAYQPKKGVLNPFEEGSELDATLCFIRQFLSLGDVHQRGLLRDSFRKWHGYYYLGRRDVTDFALISDYFGHFHKSPFSPFGVHQLVCTLTTPCELGHPKPACSTLPPFRYFEYKYEIGYQMRISAILQEESLHSFKYRCGASIGNKEEVCERFASFTRSISPTPQVLAILLHKETKGKVIPDAELEFAGVHYRLVACIERISDHCWGRYLSDAGFLSFDSFKSHELLPANAPQAQDRDPDAWLHFLFYFAI